MMSITGRRLCVTENVMKAYAFDKLPVIIKYILLATKKEKENNHGSPIHSTCNVTAVTLNIYPSNLCVQGMFLQQRVAKLLNMFISGVPLAFLSLSESRLLLPLMSRFRRFSSAFKSITLSSDNLRTPDSTSPTSAVEESDMFFSF